ncbi:MAG: hypothetical protein GKR94_29845 [Gammaproteobacteria bacterium]|nr:hypothetical protein [Gammaproteobacteria bacterium]
MAKNDRKAQRYSLAQAGPQRDGVLRLSGAPGSGLRWNKAVAEEHRLVI